MNPVPKSGFLRCDYCGNTYRDDRECCPHCNAPRPVVDKADEGTSSHADDVPRDRAKALGMLRGLITTNEARSTLSLEDKMAGTSRDKTYELTLKEISSG